MSYPFSASGSDIYVYFYPDRPLIRELNSSRFDKHAINFIDRDEITKKEVSIRCNCGRDTHHPIKDGKIDWGSLLTQKEVNVLTHKTMNSDKFGKHGIKSFLYDLVTGEETAIVCNCGSSHEIINSKVVWTANLSQKEVSILIHES